MNIFLECNDEEIAVFERIANGDLPEKCDPDIVRSLVAKNLLNDHASFMTIPMYVLKQWEDQKKLTPEN